MGRLLKLIIVLVALVFVGCHRKHYTKKHPWHPKRANRLDSRYERCYNP